MENRNIELAYMAGILDGDGSFSLIKARSRSASPLYYPMVQLANISEDLIKFCHTFGGTIGERTSYKAKDGGIRKKCYCWRLKGADQCLSFIETVCPYLVIKKERALFLKKYINEHPFKRGSNKLKPRELMSREKAYLRMRKFNDEPCIRARKYSQWEKSPIENDEFHAYVAGIMDTDGSFSVKKENRSGRKNPTYSPLISLSMTDRRAIYYISDIYDKHANVSIVKAKTAINGFCYRFYISHWQVIEYFLKHCIPFLKVKKNQANVLLRFCEDSSDCLYRSQGLSADELFFRESCYQQIIKLNKYGVDKSPLIVLKTQTDNAEGNKVQAGDKPGSMNAVSEETPAMEMRYSELLQ